MYLGSSDSAAQAKPVEQCVRPYVCSCHQEMQHNQVDALPLVKPVIPVIVDVGNILQLSLRLRVQVDAPAVDSLGARQLIFLEPVVNLLKVVIDGAL